ncbi:hypothetical protein GCM10025778_35560 [Paeniglutamicibacter antarcticus]|uniref:CbtA family protein n=1 Tax=Paeniglutamicibacter antarcticus TaxID=494023 RepID=A0ABP9TTJ0_9MICC
MSADDVSDLPRGNVRVQKASVIWSVAAACLLLGSAVLQFLASLQRWVVFRGSFGPEDVSAEDHRFDYDFPSEPWESIGTAAQFFGVGTFLQALGVLAIAFGVLLLSGEAGPRSDLISVVEMLLAAIVAASFGFYGAHALVSGVTDVPSPLQYSWVSGLLGFPALIALGWLWRRKSRAATNACVFLIGSTLGGYVVASTLIAPIFAGYVSHDTTPWRETVVAVSTAIAGITMLCAVGMADQRLVTTYHRIRQSVLIVRGWAVVRFRCGFGSGPPVKGPPKV